MGPYEVRASEAKQGGTERDSGLGSLRRHWGRVGLFWEVLGGMVMLSRRQEAGGQQLELELNLELGQAGMGEVGVSSWAGRQGRSCSWPQ